MAGEALLVLPEQGMCGWGTGRWHSLKAVRCPGFMMWPCEPVCSLPQRHVLADITLKAVSGLHPCGFLRTSAVPFHLSSSILPQSVSHSLAINSLPSLKAGSKHCKGHGQHKRSPPGSVRAIGTGWGGQGHFTGQPVGPFEIFGSRPALVFWPRYLPLTADFSPCVSCPSCSVPCPMWSRLFTSLEETAMA